jgi:tyrosinase
MAYKRNNVWELGSDWADPVLWYARGVKVMKTRALSEPTGWRFYGAIHGINQDLWQQLGYLGASDRYRVAATLRPIGTSVSTVAGTSCLGIAAI